MATARFGEYRIPLTGRLTVTPGKNECQRQQPNRSTVFGTYSHFQHTSAGEDLSSATVADDELRRIFAERDAAAAKTESDAKAVKDAEALRNRQYAKVAGAVLLVVALVAVLVWNSNQDKGTGTGGGDLGCTLAVGGLGLLVQGFTHNETSAVMLSKVAVPAIGGYACKQVIDAMTDSPTKPVTITVTAGTQRTYKTFTRNDLLTPAPTTTIQPVPRDRFLHCVTTYDFSTVAYGLCLDGLG